MESLPGYKSILHRSHLFLLALGMTLNEHSSDVNLTDLTCNESRVLP